MRVIWKFNLLIANDGPLKMPVGARVVHVASQYGNPDSVQLWALVDPEAAYEAREFVVRGTGHFVRDDEVHVGSAIATQGHLVWHVFEVVPSAGMSEGKL